MKILHTVNQYYPEVGGSEEAVRQVSERLVRLGHDVTVATGFSGKRSGHLINGVRIRDFRCSGNIVDGLRGEVDAYRTFLCDEQFDLMLNYGTQIWCTDLALGMLSAISAKKILVPCCYYRLEEPRYTSYFEDLPRYLKLYDAVIYFSERNDDCNFARTRGLTNGTIIPNATDPDEFPGSLRGAFRKQFHLNEEVIVLNVSNHGWVKNHDFFWHCVPSIKQAGAVPILIGEPYAPAPLKWLKQCYAPCRLKGLRHTVPVLEGCPRKLVREAFADADIFLFGSRFECSPLVMFEAFASGTLFITTDCGNVADAGDIAHVVRNEVEAIGIIRDYIADRSRFRPRLDRGIDLVREQHNWDSVTHRYEKLYKRILANT
jgi:glycosyltransferase involved in cell wall biosynthesis